MKGVTGVPFTVINEKYAVSGAQKADIFYQVRGFTLLCVWNCFISIYDPRVAL